MNVSDLMRDGTFGIDVTIALAYHVHYLFQVKELILHCSMFTFYQGLHLLHFHGV